MSEAEGLAVIVLAAGSGSRMGGAGPKQLLPLGGSGLSLLQNAVNAAREFVGARNGGDEIFIVLGANHEQISAATDLTGCTLLVNNAWTDGMSASIRAGVSAAQGRSGCLILVADQPLLDSEILSTLMARQQDSGAPIVVSTFAQGDSAEKLPGPPAFFSADFFAELLKLEGDSGARKVVMAHREMVEMVQFDGGALDVDTPVDYERACL